MAITVLARDRHLNITGVIDTWTKVDVVLRFNQVGSWSIEFPATQDTRDLIAPGGGIILVRDDDVLLSGKVEHTAYAWSADDDTAGPGALTLSGADDLGRLGGRLVYPDPATDAEHQTATAHYTRTRVSAEQLMRDLVRLNAGTAALLRPHSRRIPGLILGPSLGTPGTASINARFTPLLDELRSIADAGGGLGFRVRHALDGTARLVFEIYQARDLTGAARFSEGMGNLRMLSYARQSPTANVALVAGEGKGTARTIREFRDADSAAAWDEWVETWVDRRDTNDADQLAQAARDALAQGAQTVELAATPIDTPTLRYGPDNPAAGVQGYGLGDLVTVEPLPGEQVAQLVREIHLEATPDEGETATPLVGTAQATSDPTWITTVARLERRVAAVERD